MPKPSWTDTPGWAPIFCCGSLVRPFNMTSEVAISQRVMLKEVQIEQPGFGPIPRLQVRTLWKKLALLPRKYEDLCRELFAHGLGRTHVGAPQS